MKEENKEKGKEKKKKIKIKMGGEYVEFCEKLGREKKNKKYCIFFFNLYIWWIYI